MSIVTQRYMLGVSPGSNSPRIRCSMGDTARDIKLLLYDSDGLFSIPSGVSAVIKGTKSNNVGFLHSCTVGDNYVIFTIVEDMSDIPGVVICEIQLTDSNSGIIGTSNFVIQVENPALSDDSDIGDVDTDIITGIITDIETYKSLVNSIVTDYKDETDQAIDGLRASVGNDVAGVRETVNNAVSVLNSRMDLALQELNKHEVQTVLFEDTLNPLAYVDDTATLEADPTTFDYIDFYYKTHVNDSGQGNWDKVFRFEPNSLFPTIVSVQPSDTSATSKTLYVHELSFNISDNVVTVLRSRRWSWTGSSSSSANVEQSSSSSGTAPDNMYGGRVYKIVGVNISDIDELTDLRIGVDGTVYQSAGTAIRTQFANITGVYKLSVPGSSAVHSGNLTSGDFAKAYSAFTSGKGVYAVKDGEVYQLVDASSSSMSYCNIYIGAMKAIKKIVTYSNDTFEMSVNFINGSFVSYDNTNSGLSATNVQDAIDENTEELTELNERLDALGDGVPTEVREAIYNLFGMIPAYTGDPSASRTVLASWKAVITSITLNVSTASISGSNTTQLVATTAPAGSAVTWSSSDTSVATVSSSGLVTGVGNGSCTITASSGDKTARCTVTVTGFATLVSISAVYTQSGSVYESTALNDLKSDLVVTGTYNDSTTATITDYTLSGTLSVGTSTITVSYGGKSTTFNVTVSSAPLVPSAYQQVEYIKATGTQHIITDLATNNGPGTTGVDDIITQYSADIDFAFDEWQSAYATNIAFSCGSSGGGWIGYVNSKTAIGMGTNTGNYFTSGTVTERYQYHWSWSGTTATFKRNDNAEISRSNSESSTVTRRFALFTADSQTASSSNYHFNGKVYRATVYRSGEKVLDLVPCFRKSDNEIGVYDTVGDTFYTNSGTGTFEKGGNV